MAIDPNTLQLLAATGLGNYIGQDPKALEDALYGTMATDIERQSGTNAQAALENTFARGVGQRGTGPSSITSDVMTPIERARTDALLKARNQAQVSANQAQLAGLAQAAGAAQNAINSQQSGNIAQQQINQAKKNAALQEKLGTQQAVGAGVGGLGSAALSTAGMLYAPQIRRGLQSLADLGTSGEKMPSYAATLGSSAPTASDFTSPSTTFGGEIMPAAYDFTSALPDVSSSVPDYSSALSAMAGPVSSWGGGGFDLPELDWSQLWNVPSNLSFDWGW